jgi:hypothetical protein
MSEDIDIEWLEATILVFHLMSEKSLSADLNWSCLILNQF